MSDNERLCSNCNKAARLSSALVFQHGGKVVGVICDDCQKATKIRIDLTRTKKGWKFTQYFPVEA
jgi:hypothetical protein